jgi:GxxExxY protein
MSLAQEELSYAVIGKAMEVHRELGPGVDEIFYHELLGERLRAAGIEHLYKPRRALGHRGQTVDMFEPDLVFPGCLIVELKWLWGAFAPEHFLQLKSYLKFWRIKDGLLLDFGKESLVPKRYIFEDSPGSPLDVAQAVAEATSTGVQIQLAEALCGAVAKVDASHGLGYRDTTYRALLDAELRAEGVGCILAPLATIRAGDRRLGESRLPCLAVANQGAVMLLAQRDGIRAADQAILQSWLRHLGFPWGAIVHFGKRAVQLRWVGATSACETASTT